MTLTFPSHIIIIIIMQQHLQKLSTHPFFIPSIVTQCWNAQSTALSAVVRGVHRQYKTQPRNAEYGKEQVLWIQKNLESEPNKVG